MSQERWSAQRQFVIQFIGRLCAIWKLGGLCLPLPAGRENTYSAVSCSIFVRCLQKHTSENWDYYWTFVDVLQRRRSPRNMWIVHKAIVMVVHKRHLLRNSVGKRQIPLRYLVADRFEAGRRPAASWNLAYHLDSSRFELFRHVEIARTCHIISVSYVFNFCIAVYITVCVTVCLAAIWRNNK